MRQIHAPWTPDQVASLNAYQKAGYVHPFTSVWGVILTATEAGWIEHPNCPVVQDWAHEFMTDWSWRMPWIERTEGGS